MVNEKYSYSICKSFSKEELELLLLNKEKSEETLLNIFAIDSNCFESIQITLRHVDNITKLKGKRKKKYIENKLISIFEAIPTKTVQHFSAKIYEDLSVLTEEEKIKLINGDELIDKNTISYLRFNCQEENPGLVKYTKEGKTFGVSNKEIRIYKNNTCIYMFNNQPYIYNIKEENKNIPITKDEIELIKNELYYIQCDEDNEYKAVYHVSSDNDNFLFHVRSELMFFKTTIENKRFKPDRNGVIDNNTWDEIQNSYLNNEECILKFKIITDNAIEPKNENIKTKS